MSASAARARREYSAAENSCLGVHHVQQVMRHAGALFRGRLGAADVETAVHLQAVAGDDLAPPLEREAHGQRALAGRGGPDDGDQGSWHSRNAATTSANASSTTAPLDLGPAHRSRKARTILASCSVPSVRLTASSSA